MEKRVYVRILDGLGAKAKYSSFKTNANGYLRGLRTGIVLWNNPSFTNLVCKIYTIRNGAPQKLLGTSTNSWNQSDLQTEDYRAVKLYFTFDDIELEGDTFYHAVFEATGYVYAGNSWVGLMLWHPNPVNDGQSTEAIDLSIAPARLIPIVRTKEALSEL